MPAAPTTILALSARPGLVPLVARWLVDAFQDDDGLSVAQMDALIRAATAPADSFVLLAADGTPAGTASLAERDLDSRPDLTPWLAGVYVPPAFRGRGHAEALVRHVEAHAATAGIARLWLYTEAAAPLYARLGWRHAGWERTRRSGKAVALMRRDLSPAADPWQ